MSGIQDSSAAVRAAFDLARRGLTAQAEALCLDILACDGEQPEALLLRAILEVQSARPAEGAATLRRLLRLDSSRPAAHALLGDALMALRQAQAALASYDEALRRAPQLASAHYGRGNALLDAGRFAEAIASYDRVLLDRPDDADALCNRGNAFLQWRRYSDALDSYERAIRVRPSFAAAHNNRGAALHGLRRWPEALEAYDEAVRLRGEFPDALLGRGNVLRHLKRPAEALDSFERALVAQVDNVDALRGRGDALLDLGRPGEALAPLEAALHLDPCRSDVHNSLGNSLRTQNRIPEALASYDRAIDLDARNAAAHFNRGIALERDGGYERKTIVSYARALELDPTIDYGPGMLAYAQRHQADWSVRVPAAGNEAIQMAVLAGQPAIAPLALLSLTDCAATQLACARAFVAARGAQDRRSGSNTIYRHERIRIAYVSADFREHAVTYLMAGVFERHDSARFETIGVALRPEDTSVLGQRVKRAFGRFIDVSADDDIAVARRLQNLEVDIAVDLTGLTSGSRPDIFRHRAAPIQVNYLGYPGTSGASFMDYLIADAFVIPEDQRVHYAEHVVYLPECFQANDDSRERGGVAPDRHLAGLPAHAFVFACFNNTHKVDPMVFDVWMRLLAKVPDSVLWLLAQSEAAADNLRNSARRRGIDPRRLIFAARVPYAEYLNRLKLADLHLDTLPFNAGTTASDVLWAGAPLLTCSGRAFAARMAGSLLHAAGVPELVTCDLNEYESRALELARQPSRLASLRRDLEVARHDSPLFNTDRFRRHLESAFESMWLRHARGEPPESFAVSAIGGADDRAPQAQD